MYTQHVVLETSYYVRLHMTKKMKVMQTTLPCHIKVYKKNEGIALVLPITILSFSIIIAKDEGIAFIFPF